MKETLVGLQQIVVSAAAEKKAIDIVLLDLRGRSDITDYFMICSGSSKAQVQAIANAIIEEALLANIKPAFTEGYTSGTWVIIDFMDIIVHVFLKDAREFYDLERLWGDAPAYREADVTS
ncbi:MAG: ribosome silencing factor [Nitrospinae bacterium CG11_big_fil_rev_8_21_14_0_20_45_15]|nr:MAG: ribosome silencing factor [Nitrospinae bacterium CG11_big_fil_rev_8_21_14_0_20_45_15]